MELVRFPYDTLRARRSQGAMSHWRWGVKTDETEPGNAVRAAVSAAACGGWLPPLARLSSPARCFSLNMRSYRWRTRLAGLLSSPSSSPLSSCKCLPHVRVALMATSQTLHMCMTRSPLFCLKCIRLQSLGQCTMCSKLGFDSSIAESAWVFWAQISVGL